MFGLGSLISPRVGLGIIRKQLEDELNKHWKLKNDGHVFEPVNAFQLVINNMNNKIYFVVKGKEYPYNDGATLSKLITTMVTQKVGTNTEIHLIIIEYGEKTNITVAYAMDGNKQQKQIEI